MKIKGEWSDMKARKIARLKDKAYRDAFVASQISVGLPFQIRSLREKRNIKQSDLAKKSGMLQPRISAMESPGGAKFTLETLRRVASAFDVALIVRFAPFSELLGWSDRFEPDEFAVPSFEDDFASGQLENNYALTQAGAKIVIDANVFANAAFIYHQSVLSQDAVNRQIIDKVETIGKFATFGTYQSKIPILKDVVAIPKMPPVSETSQTSFKISGTEARTTMYARTK